MANASIRYGFTLRKRYEAIKKEKKTLYKCPACGKEGLKRISTSIWQCKYCNATYAGGAYSFSTPAGEASIRLLQGGNK